MPYVYNTHSEGNSLSLFPLFLLIDREATARGDRMMGEHAERERGGISKLMPLCIFLNGRGAK